MGDILFFVFKSKTHKIMIPLALVLMVSSVHSEIFALLFMALHSGQPTLSLEKDDFML